MDSFLAVAPDELSRADNWLARSLSTGERPRRAVPAAALQAAGATLTQTGLS